MSSNPPYVRLDIFILTLDDGCCSTRPGSQKHVEHCRLVEQIRVLTRVTDHEKNPNGVYMSEGGRGRRRQTLRVSWLIKRRQLFMIFLRFWFAGDLIWAEVTKWRGWVFRRGGVTLGRQPDGVFWGARQEKHWLMCSRALQIYGINVMGKRGLFYLFLSCKGGGKESLPPHEPSWTLTTNICLLRSHTHTRSWPFQLPLDLTSHSFTSWLFGISLVVGLITGGYSLPSPAFFYTLASWLFGIKLVLHLKSGGISLPSRSFSYTLATRGFLRSMRGKLVLRVGFGMIPAIHVGVLGVEQSNLGRLELPALTADAGHDSVVVGQTPDLAPVTIGFFVQHEWVQWTRDSDLVRVLSLLQGSVAPSIHVLHRNVLEILGQLAQRCVEFRYDGFVHFPHLG